MSSEISSDRGKEYQEIKARLETENIFVLLRNTLTMKGNFADTRTILPIL
jgi:hypothetical protein